MLKRRGKGSRNWARGVFASFWILLAGVSGVYLFSAFTDPTALGGQLVKLNPLPGGGSASSGETTSAVTASQSSGARDQELAEIKASLRELSQQVAELSSRLSPAEKSAETSAPAPSTPTPEPSAAAAPPAPPAEEAKPVQAEAPKPAETPPPPEAKPVEQAAVEVKQAPQTPQEATPALKPFEPPAVAVSPLEEPPAEDTAEPSSDLSAPAPSPAAVEEAPTPPQPAATESAGLDPTALPPAANDGSTRYGIEIGTVAKQDGLRPLWREFLTNHAALVAGLQPRRVLAPDKKWRLIAGPFSSAAEAAQACALFKKASRPCEATVYAGDGL